MADEPVRPVASPASLSPQRNERRDEPQSISTRFGDVPRPLAVLGFAAVIVVTVNLFTWSGDFWAAWPLLAFAVMAVASLARKLAPAVRGPVTLLVIGLGIVGINLLTWHDRFWAVWPMLGLAALAGFRWMMRPGAEK